MIYYKGTLAHQSTVSNIIYIFYYVSLLLLLSSSKPYKKSIHVIIIIIYIYQSLGTYTYNMHIHIITSERRRVHRHYIILYYCATAVAENIKTRIQRLFGFSFSSSPPFASLNPHPAAICLDRADVKVITACGRSIQIDRLSRHDTIYYIIEVPSVS